MSRVEMPPDQVILAIAQRIHAQYLADQAGRQDPSHPAMRPWDELTDELRSQNIDQARHNVAKLCQLGYQLVPAGTTGGTASIELSAEQLEELARDEHDRWADEKRANGYQTGEVRCDDPPDLRHPDLVAWEDLSEETREKDREPVRQMVTRLAEAGYEMTRE